MSLVSKTNTATNKYELEIKVSAEDFEKACQKVYLRRVKKIEIPGFRKGKAPRKTIEKLYGEGFFYEEAVNDIYPTAIQEAVTESGLEIVCPPEVDVADISKENGVTFKAICTVKPEVTVKDYKGIKAAKDVKAVTDEDVNAEIDRMRDRNSRTITVEDRPAANGDTVVIDFEGFVDGVAFDGGKAEKFSLTLGSGQFIPGFEDQVIGHEAGEEFDVNVSFPEEYQATELAGKPAVFKVKIHEVKAKELPAADDEFAKDVSEYDTLDELKANIRKGMEEQNESRNELEVENALVDQIVESMEADIPACMIETRIDEMVRDFEFRLQQQGLKLKDYLKYIGGDEAKFREGFKEQAEKQVKIRLALEKVVELEKIEASDEDFDKEVNRIAEAYKMEADKVRAIVPEAEVRKDLAVNKAIDFIKSNAKVTAEKATKAKRTTKKAAAAKAEKTQENTEETAE